MQSLHLEKALKLFRGWDSPALDVSRLLMDPSEFKPGKFPRARLVHSRDIWASGSVLHAPPPISLADSAFTSDDLGTSAVDGLQSYALSSLDTAALQDEARFYISRRHCSSRVTTLGTEVGPSCKLVPVRPSAYMAASLATVSGEREACKIMVAPASRPSRLSLGHGHHAPPW